MAYHQYVPVTSAEEECEHLGRDLRDNPLMILHNHGALACGRSAAEAFWYLYYLEMSCKIQVDILAAGKDYIVPTEEAIDAIAQYGIPTPAPRASREWPSLLRMLDRIDPSYRN